MTYNVFGGTLNLTVSPWLQGKEGRERDEWSGWGHDPFCNNSTVDSLAQSTSEKSDMLMMFSCVVLVVACFSFVIFLVHCIFCIVAENHIRFLTARF